MTETANLTRVVLSLPSLLALADTTARTDGPPRSWIQLARTGTFHSARYGTFSITKEDLSTMVRNFCEVTPKAPTELPVDWDHLSIDPKRPGDGAAAGWIKKLELRQDGSELFGEVEWTPRGADAIKNQEYRFVSPSFVKDHVHKDGRKIGTTLLAAAITNHPFLESMRALTLYSFAAMGDIALTSVVGHDQSDQQRAEVGPHADDTQVPVRESTEPTTSEEKHHMSADISSKAAGFEQRVIALSKGRTARAAIALATVQDAAGAEAYRLAGVARDGSTQTGELVLTLSTHPGESFDELALRYASERRVSLRQAIHDVAQARPDLAAAR